MGEKGKLYVVDSYNFNIKMFIFWNKSIVCFSELSLYFKMIMKKFWCKSSWLMIAKFWLSVQGLIRQEMFHHNCSDLFSSQIKGDSWESRKILYSITITFLKMLNVFFKISKLFLFTFSDRSDQRFQLFSESKVENISVNTLIFIAKQISEL